MRFDHEKKSDGERVDNEKRSDRVSSLIERARGGEFTTRTSDGVRFHHGKERWGDSSR